MASWKFTDDYQAQYPALPSSVFSLLVFSDHSIDGESFTGDLDVAASGAALAVIGQWTGLSSIAMAGTVSSANGTLSISLASSDAAGFTAAIAKSIPLIGGSLTTNASLTLSGTIHATDDPDDGPTAQAFQLSVTFTVGSHTATISAQVPMGRLLILNGTFIGIGIGLNDLNFLMGGSGSSQWFPSSDLGPYASGTPAFELLSAAIVMRIGQSPFSLKVTSVTISVGITNIPLMGQALYLNPLAVTVAIPIANSAPPVWALQGDLVLCNYARPGDTTNPDFTLDMQMNLSDFSVSANLLNPSSLPVATMVQDLLGESANFGLPPALTINTFDISAQADKQSGTISSFSTDFEMSGGFGLLADLDLESISVSVEYAA